MFDIFTTAANDIDDVVTASEVGSWAVYTFKDVVAAIDRTSEDCTLIRRDGARMTFALEYVEWRKDNGDGINLAVVDGWSYTDHEGHDGDGDIFEPTLGEGMNLDMSPMFRTIEEWASDSQ